MNDKLLKETVNKKIRKGQILFLILFDFSVLPVCVWGGGSGLFIQVLEFHEVVFKGTVSAISSDPPCKDGNARFTVVPLKT